MQLQTRSADEPMTTFYRCCNPDCNHNWLSRSKLSNVANVAVPSMAARVSVENLSSEILAVGYLKSGSVIALPTDTVYGLACDATNSSAINRLYAVKCRNENKPLAICLGEISEVKSWAYIQHLPYNLLSALLPGPVTLILNCTTNGLDKSLSLGGKVGIRIPDYPFIRHLACGLGKPLALTSANLSNEPSAVDISGFSSILYKIPAVFDAGNLGENHSASTVIDLSEIGHYIILRGGAGFTKTVNILKKFGLQNKY
ncbi:hypothetical protein NQ318_020360 [Aromia moschata]|uniref:Threonylcarbamoyl-AMP synthase n=1 Tax=Aromia moschata TaxID=1265417 RepID=A0AAV8XID7_9CUCU|nr:hypothetical protein NQ318_020360 [Aromia moschata]